MASSLPTRSDRYRLLKLNRLYHKPAYDSFALNRRISSHTNLPCLFSHKTYIISSDGWSGLQKCCTWIPFLTSIERRQSQSSFVLSVSSQVQMLGWEIVVLPINHPRLTKPLQTCAASLIVALNIIKVHFIKTISQLLICRDVFPFSLSLFSHLKPFFEPYKSFVYLGTAAHLRHSSRNFFHSLYCAKTEIV